jgi:hypothetical protein
MTEDGGRKDEAASLSVVSPLTSVIWFAQGLAAASRSVFLFVVFGTYVGIGALAHDLDFSLPWALATTLLVWAAPNQVILISALGAGMAPLAAAIAVSLSGVRLLPMVVSLLPLIKTPSVRARALIVPAHFTAISVWIEGLRLLPGVARPCRIAFYNGLGAGLLASASAGTAAGFTLAANVCPVVWEGFSREADPYPDSSPRPRSSSPSTTPAGSRSIAWRSRSVLASAPRSRSPTSRWISCGPA